MNNPQCRLNSLFYSIIASRTGLQWNIVIILCVKCTIENDLLNTILLDAVYKHRKKVMVTCQTLLAQREGSSLTITNCLIELNCQLFSTCMHYTSNPYHTQSQKQGTSHLCYWFKKGNGQSHGEGISRKCSFTYKYLTF